VHRARLLAPVIHPLESAEPTNENTRRLAVEPTQSDAPGVELGITPNHQLPP
jgi:hypothetical protein